MAMLPRRSQSSGFTLVEILITVAIALMIFLSVIYGIMFSMRAQVLAREHSLAQRQAASLIEEARELSFRELEAYKGKRVLIDDNRTDGDGSEEDDLYGTANLRLFRLNTVTGELTEVDDGMIEADPTDPTSVETIEDFLMVQAEVEWESIGKEKKVVMTSHFAP